MQTTFDIPRLRRQLRDLSFRPGQVKTAELGGGQDTPFEQAFSNLAHAYIRDKAPKLLDFEVGFQLIEKNQENTKAVGVFGFKVGPQWLYAPVFFLNGDLKGHELLYIKNQDAFVPLKENWLNYLLGRKPSILGEGVNRNLSQHGVLAPNLYQLSRSPNKFASDGIHCPKCGQPHYGPSGACPMTDNRGGDPSAVMSMPMPVAADPTGPQHGDNPPAATHPSGGQPPQADPAVMNPSRLNHYAGGPDHPPESGRHGGPTLEGHQLPLPFASQPNITPLDGNHLPKLAAWARAFLPDLAYFATQDPAADPKFAGLLGFPDLLKEAGEPLLRFLLEKVGHRHPDLLAAIDAAYGPDLLTGVARAASEKLAYGSRCMKPSRPKRPGRPKKSAPVKRASILAGLTKEAAAKPKKVRVVTLDEVNAGRVDLLHGLDSAERERLLKERVVVKDDRDDKDITLAFNVQTQMKLVNPDQTNIYMVLVKPDKFEKCLVVVGPYDERGRNNFCTVVHLETGRWLNIHPSYVWCEQEYDDQTWRKWFDGLKGEDAGGDGTRLLLTPWGQGTCPYKVHESHGEDATGGDLYEVYFKDWAELSRPVYRAPVRSYDSVGEGCHHRPRIRCTGRPGKSLRVLDGEVAVPLGYKVIRVDPAGVDSDFSSEKPPLRLGNLVDIEIALANRTRTLKLYADGKDVTLDEARRLNKVAALKALILEYGLREKTAREVLARAEHAGTTRGQSYRVILKTAAPGDPIGDMVAGAPNAPSFPEPNTGFDPLTGSNVPTMNESEFNTKVTDMSASKTDRSIYQPQGPDPKSMQVAQQAAQTGQREVFDTAMLGSMLKALRQDSMVEKYLGDLMKGMDRLGRILFLFYWHGEEFEERYGKQDMPELEDGLRNSFEAIGDIVLVLKRQSVDPYPDEGTDVDLSALANQ